MKKIALLVGLMILVFSFTAMAFDQVDLTVPRDVSPSTADKIRIVEYNIRVNPNRLIVTYRWYDSGSSSYAHQNKYQILVIRNLADDPATDVTLCTDVGVPFGCCTGVGTGDCDESTTDFNDIFGYTIQAGDVGTILGPRLKQAILNKMKTIMGFEGDFE